MMRNRLAFKLSLIIIFDKLANVNFFLHRKEKELKSAAQIKMKQGQLWNDSFEMKRMHVSDRLFEKMLTEIVRMLPRVKTNVKINHTIEEEE